MNNFKKGEYEEAVECAKKLLDSNAGMLEIVSKTNLSEDQVKKIMRKKERELNDKQDKLFK